MNERIKELARQASNGFLSYDAEGEWKLNEEESEKFALLIVRECAELVDRAMSDGGVDGRVVKKHFGVEE